MDEHKPKRTEITIETVSVTRIRATGGRVAWCEHCGRNVTPVKEQIAMTIFGNETDNLAAMYREGRLHRLSETEICGDSLERRDHTDRWTREKL